MSTAKPRLAVVDQPPAPAPAAAPTQLQLTRALARAFARRRRAEALLRAAEAEIDAAFFPWAANRSIGRDEAEAHLESAGHLPRRKVWE